VSARLVVGGDRRCDGGCGRRRAHHEGRGAGAREHDGRYGTSGGEAASMPRVARVGQGGSKAVHWLLLLGGRAMRRTAVRRASIWSGGGGHFLELATVSAIRRKRAQCTHGRCTGAGPPPADNNDGRSGTKTHDSSWGSAIRGYG